MLAQGLADDRAKSPLTRRTIVYAVATSVSYFALQVFAVWLTSRRAARGSGAGSVAMGADRARGHQFRPRGGPPGDVPALGLPPGRRGAARASLQRLLRQRGVRTGCFAAGVCAMQPDLPGGTKNDAFQRPQAGGTPCDAGRRRRSRRPTRFPPVWPLASSVAVNPFLGQAHEDLALVGARLERVAGARVTMPRRWYQARIAGGVITDADLSDALARGSAAPRPASLSALRRAALASRPEISAAPTIADLAARVSGIDWPGLIAERFGAWAAGYFDEGQALWPAPRGGGAYDAWRAVATHDLTPEIFGLSGFAAFVSRSPRARRMRLPASSTGLRSRPTLWKPISISCS